MGTPAFSGADFFGAAFFGAAFFSARFFTGCFFAGCFPAGDFFAALLTEGFVPGTEAFEASFFVGTFPVARVSAFVAVDFFAGDLPDAFFAAAALRLDAGVGPPGLLGLWAGDLVVVDLLMTAFLVTAFLVTFFVVTAFFLLPACLATCFFVDAMTSPSPWIDRDRSDLSSMPNFLKKNQEEANLCPFLGAEMSQDPKRRMQATMPSVDNMVVPSASSWVHLKWVAKCVVTGHPSPTDM